MPTLFRLLVALLFLGGLGYAGLFALTVLVEPGEKLITVRIPQRDLIAQPLQLPTANTTTEVPAPIVSSDPAPAVEDDQPE